MHQDRRSVNNYFCFFSQESHVTHLIPFCHKGDQVLEKDQKKMISNPDQPAQAADHDQIR